MQERLRTAVQRLLVDRPVPGASVGREHLYLLDAARGLAAAAVLFFHYVHFFVVPGLGRADTPVEQYPLYGVFWLLYDYGKEAVPIFWMISGFVFSRVYRESRATSRDFFLNRFARLYPLHLLTLCVVALLQAIALARYGHSFLFGNNDPYHFMLQLFFASNWGLQAGDSFNAPIWSVSVEVMIYVIFWAVHRRLFARGVIGPMVLMAGSFALFMTTGSLIAQCGFFFFFGAGLFYVHEVLGRERGLFLACIAALMALGLAVFATAGVHIVNGVGVPAFFGGVILLLVWSEPAARPYRRWLAMIGDNTYGTYLWHVPMQITLLLLFAHGGNLAAAARSPWFLLGYLAAVFLVARLSFVWFERPMRLWLRQIGKRRPRAERPALSAP